MHSLTGDSMHGSIFVFLKRFVEYKHNYNTWVDVLEEVGLRNRVPYQMNEVYPTSELFIIMSAAARVQGVSDPVFQEKFGEFLVPDLLLVFKRFIDPSWRTQEMLLHIGSHMHAGIKRENDATNPPPLHVSKVGKNMLVIDYHSKRRMAGFAVGIIKGLAQYFDEGEKINVLPSTEPNAERVQIRIEFV
ncbi:heme NO-binding domain-containing protein [Pontibacter pamirensis]|uniref:heme NO-binding domain-containing protein n=1 Tax=Pontibacter pamirensis TaxID=2562824 RepID=UPI00138A25E7|nr:heme NO-binding domain-containing protein [Pontibacter pamirensis]